MYQAEYSEIYDAIYQSRGKNYQAECMELTRLVRSRKRDASTLLDVACGTGSHLRFLLDDFDHTVGLDISPDMLTVARKRIPGLTTHQADMRNFELPSRYDAAICMFSSIGYLGTVEDLREALDCLVRHLVRGGVLVIEPWYFPERYIPGYVAADVVKEDLWAVSRMSHSVRTGNNVDITVHYLIADGTSGIRHLVEAHPMTLFTKEQYEEAFTRAGCDVEYLTGEPFTCGLFVGVRR